MRKTRKRPKRAKPSPLEDWLLDQIREAGLPEPEREYRFHPTRRWRFDMAWKSHKVAAEVDGAIFSGGRHATGSGIVKDSEKYNEALCLGWKVLRIVKPHLQSGEALRWVAEALGYELEEEE